VRKAPCIGDIPPTGRPGGDDLPFVFSGTLVVKGHGIAQSQAIGAHTEIGKIGKSLQTVEPEQGLLQKETKRLVLLLATIGLSVSAIIVVVYGLTRDDWLQGLLAGITLSMAVLPEEFPVVLTIFLALGAWRISKARVLTRHAPTVETMGSTTVLCVDKTGTLTLNRMSVARIYAQGQFYDLRVKAPEQLPDNLHEIVESSIQTRRQNQPEIPDIRMAELGLTKLILNFAQSTVIRSS
jgi:Ca2+-transporting ATPase